MAFNTVAGQSQGYRYSYSGSDAKAYVHFPGRADRASYLEALHTISWSIHEEKGQAHALGYRGLRGFARGVRTIAGSLIMTVIEDNPLAPVMNMMADLYLDPALRWQGWSLDWQTVGVGSGLDYTTFNRRLATTLPPLNILVQYVAEGSQWVENTGSFMEIPGAAWLLEGVEFIDEGGVTSVSDSATEMNYSFIAMDMKPISLQQFNTPLFTGLTVDPGAANAAAVEQAITGVYRQQAIQYREQVNFINGGGTGFGGGPVSGLA